MQDTNEAIPLDDSLNEQEARENLILHMNNTRVFLLKKKLKKNVEIRRLLRND